MQIYPTAKEAANYLKEFSTVPVMTEMIGDLITPVNVFLNIREKGACFLLESAENERRFGRYSFIGYDPRRIISYSDDVLSVTENGETKTKKLNDPFPVIDDYLKQNICPVMPGLPKFSGGLAGYFAYDAARIKSRPVKNQSKSKSITPPPDDINIPLIGLIEPSKIIAFDHLRHKLLLITHIHNEPDSYKKARAELTQMREFIENLTIGPRANNAKADRFTVNKTNSLDFIKTVEKAKEHIINGDIYQTVLSLRFDIENPPCAFNVYRQLRMDDPSPYMFYFSFPALNIQIAGSSPEKLVSVENGLVTTNPIAGTIHRGIDDKEDDTLIKSLLENEKERAEHIMLVDLSRNDLGRICELGTVNVDKMMEVAKFSKLMHIISQVSGSLKEEHSLTDALMACLPAGTLSGAPKTNAIRIIDALEPKKRCLYGGAIGYIGYNGCMDTCIAIRTALYANNKAYVQAGAGIVSDSAPKDEYKETHTKAAAMLAAFEKASDIL